MIVKIVAFFGLMLAVDQVSAQAVQANAQPNAQPNSQVNPQQGNFSFQNVQNTPPQVPTSSVADRKKLNCKIAKPEASDDYDSYANDGENVVIYECGKSTLRTSRQRESIPSVPQNQGGLQAAVAPDAVPVNNGGQQQGVNSALPTGTNVLVQSNIPQPAAQELARLRAQTQGIATAPANQGQVNAFNQGFQQRSPF